MNDNAPKISVSEVNAINKYSSSKEKIELYRSLFKGREDVFARRWQSTTSCKSGYQPVCVNEWAEGLCDKRKYKCANCPNRVLKSLTDEDIYKHLESKEGLARDVIGIYPMLQDETCHFLCADFDDDSFEKDVTAYDGKTEVQVYDYVDIHIPVLERMYQKRVKSYSAIGYKMKLLSNINATPDLIYDGKSFYHGFCNDLQNAILDSRKGVAIEYLSNAV